MLSEDDLREQLRACFTADNPFGKPYDLVALGMVERVTLAVDREAPGYGIPGVPVRQSLRLELVACSGDEDARRMVQAQVENLLAGLAGLSRVEVVFLEEPVWSVRRAEPGLR